MYEKFTNASDKVYENVVLTQPIDPKASVYHMSVTIGDKMILAEIHEKEEAKKIFKKATDEGMGDKDDLLKTMFHVLKYKSTSFSFKLDIHSNPLHLHREYNI